MKYLDNGQATSSIVKFPVQLLIVLNDKFGSLLFDLYVSCYLLDSKEQQEMFMGASRFQQNPETKAMVDAKYQ